MISYSDFHDVLLYVTEPDNAGGNESVERLWQYSYLAIASANEALQAIERAGNPSSLDSRKGEALITRAYNHFVLCNVFSKHYKEGSQDLGIPYITAPETSVNPHYDRETVADTYAKIEKDLLEALPLIDDNLYSQPKYHFNQKAAYAFATRFYLYYNKPEDVIRYANLVLGSNPSNLMRDWSYMAATTDETLSANRYTSVSSKSNLMLLAASSNVVYYYGRAYLGARMTYHSGIATSEATSFVGPWGKAPILPTNIWTGIPKATMQKLPMLVEYVDVVNGIGYRKSVFPVFTGEEVLLSRAEAYARKGMYDEATEDIATFTTVFMKDGATATRAQINDFFDNLSYYEPTSPSPKKALDPSGFAITAGEQENFIHCILFCRRNLTLHEGLRWFDVKRYGIKISRRLYDEYTNNYTVTDSLIKDDNRTAIQLPQDAIIGGMTANPR